MSLPSPSSSPSPESSRSVNSSSSAQLVKLHVKTHPSIPLRLTSSSRSNFTSKEDLHMRNTFTSSCSRDQIQEETASVDWIAANRCLYYPLRSNGCTEPRSCRDCLNVDVGTEYSCMVNQYGRCVRKDQSTYVKKLDFEGQEPSNDGKERGDQRVLFPASKVAYCTAQDQRCKRCRETVFKDVMEGRMEGSLTKFCYGKGECVCIAICEALMWKETIGQTVCNGTVGNWDHGNQRANANEQVKGSLMLGVIGGVVAVVFLVAVVLNVRRRRTEREHRVGGARSESATTQDRDDAAAAARSVPTVVPSTLSLFGWQAMRSELIEREQLLLAGVKEFSNVRTGYLQLLDVDVSAPPQEEDESSAPVMLVPLAGASAPSFSPSDEAAFALAPSAPLASPCRLEEGRL